MVLQASEASLEMINSHLAGYHIKLIGKEWETGLLNRNVFALVWNAEGCSDSEGHVGSQWKQVLPWICEEAQQFAPCLLVSRVPALNLAAIRALEYAGFSLMECYLEFGHCLRQIPPLKGSNVIRPVYRKEVSQLESIARQSFVYSRFHIDSHISVEEANLTRSEWVRNACMGRAEIVLVGEIGGQIAGFVVGMKKEFGQETLGVLDLVAVYPDHRNLGLGYELVIAYLGYCREHGYCGVRVGTQAHNIPAVRLYERAGFLMHEAFYSFHRHLVLLN